MSEPLPPNADHDEWRDRLIDSSLREVLGGQAPPDLADRILSAAASAPAATPVIAAGGDAMQSTRPRRRSGFGWGTLAVAAMLLIAAVFLLRPATEAARERSTAVADRDQIPTDAERGAVAEYNIVAPAGPRADEPQADFDSLADLVTSTANDDDWSTAEEASPAIDPKQPSAVSESLAFDEGGEQGASGGQQGAAGEPLVLGVVVNSETRAPTSGAAASSSGGTTVLSAGRPGLSGQGGNESAVPLEESPLTDAPAATYPDAVVWDELSARRHDRYAAGGESAQAQADRRYVRNKAKSEEAGRTLYFSESDQPFRGDSFGLETPMMGGGGMGGFGGGRGGRGLGAGAGGDQYARIIENPFKAISAATTDNRLSTFSIDVDTASYANVRQFLMDQGTLPPPDAVRLEEFVNYFDYDYSAPTGDVPFASNVEIASCPWNAEHRLVRVGIKGREMERKQRPKSNLVFLVDVSGSMDEPNKLPLLLEGMRMLTRELGENDRVAIVVYASTEGLALESTRGDQQQTILDALARLSAGGSTAGGAGIALAYKVAEENFIKDGVNRVILCTDGDFNVGVTSPADLERMAEEKAKGTGVFLTVLGFGRGNLNDAMMEAVADHGNGNYHYVDNQREARKVLVEEMTGTLVTIAKDVKIQVEFNPAAVAGYRLIGYENRVLAAEDFNDDKKDAGEIGAGHTVTALYEIVPAGAKVAAGGVDELKYAAPASDEEVADKDSEDLDTDGVGELLTLKIRYKEPDGDVSEKLEFPISDDGHSFSEASQDFQFASAVASFGMLLRQSEFKGDATLAGVLEMAESASRDRDPHGYRKEFVEMVRRARELAGD
jgi:secreted protein with Ig-like and vWFA domain